jgi:hypothetical protein
MLRTLLVHHQGPKQVGINAVNRCCDSNEGCVLVGIQCDNWKVMHRMENVRKVPIFMYVHKRNWV